MSYNALSRELRTGERYDALFPKAKGTKVNLGKGNTYKSIELIVAWVIKHNSEVKLVAQQLKKNTLKDTVLAIHDFAYNHFQYKADAEAQLLRSPAIAWKNRYDGIDCKSYTIIVSSLLLQLNLKHYIRKIKQPNFNPENFTHVYVIVPINQKTGALDQGYYTIDGTLKHTNEPNFTQKKDTYMDSLEHFGLNGTESIDTNALKSKLASLKDVSFRSFSSFFKSLSCIGGSAYDSNLFNRNVEIITNWVTTSLVAINEEVALRNSQNLGFLVAELQAVITVLRDTYVSKKNEGWKSSCTVRNFDATINYLNDFLNIVNVALPQWVNEYHTVKVGGSGNATFTNPANGGLENSHNLWGAKIGKTITISKPYAVNYTQKNTEIKAFLPDLSVATQIKEKTFDIKTWVGNASTVLVAIKTLSNSNGTGSESGTENIYDVNNQTKNTKQGSGLLLGILAVGAVGAIAFSQMKDKGVKSKK